jgi:hypothetical protein
VVAEDAGGFGSGSVYGEGNGATGDFLTGESSGSDIGEGGGYANEGGGGYVGENGQTPYVCTIGSYFPDRPISFFPRDNSRLYSSSGFIDYMSTYMSVNTTSVFRLSLDKV